ncbi:MAG TPA: PAS domain S-box protein [bacterium]|nr:PAS domain S-box protein [bacterium]
MSRANSLLSASLEATADGILIVDQQGKMVRFNRQFLDMWQIPESAVAHRDDATALKLVLSQLKDPEGFLAKVRELYAQPFAESCDLLEFKDGRFFERYSKPQRVGKEDVGRVWSFRDVTELRRRSEQLSITNQELQKEIAERSRAEEDLIRSEKQYRDLVETSHDLIWSVDLQGRLTFLNRQATRRIYGYEPEEMLGRSFTEFETPDQVEKDLAVFERVKEGQSFFQNETVQIRKDGTPIYLSYNAIVQRDENGMVTGTTGTSSDITERRRAEEKLRESEERIRAMIDHALAAVVLVDRDGVITYWNPQAEKTFGWSSFEALGRKDTDLIIPSHQVELFKRLRGRFLRSRQTGLLNRRLETSARHADGHEFPVEITVTPLRIGNSWMFSAFVLDITERKLAEEEIRRKTMELERSNKELQAFAYVASHDLQEPLHKIVAFIDRLRLSSGESLNEKGADSLDRIQKAALRMRSLIEDLLQYARVTTRAQAFEPVNLGPVVAEVLSLFDLRIAETGASLEVGPLPTVMADRSQMLRLFQNLVGNALKFCKTGEKPQVQIGAQDSSVEGQVEIVVEDRGIGLDREFFELVFKPFQRLHARSQYEGTGMGLAICQKIVDRHGGEIFVQSEAGRGAKFIVRLPKPVKNSISAA